MLESSQGRKKGDSIGALQLRSAAKLLVVACAADRQLDRICGGRAQLNFIFSAGLEAVGVLRRSCDAVDAVLPPEC